MAQIMNTEDWNRAAKVGLVQTVRMVGNDGVPRSVLSEYKNGAFNRGMDSGFIVAAVSVFAAIGGTAAVIGIIELVSRLGPSGKLP